MVLEERNPSCLCAGCGVETWPWEMYAVTDEVWLAVEGGCSFLCVGCVEDRLGRTLTPSDFSSVPLNDDRPQDSVRLRTRKGSGRVTGPLYSVAVRAVVEFGADAGEIAVALGLDESLLHRRVESTRAGLAAEAS